MEDKIRTIAEATGKNSTVRILEFSELEGSHQVEVAQTLYYAQKAGMRLRQVVIFLNNGEIVAESGALSYMKGNIKIEASTGGLGGLVKKVATSAMTNETTFRPHYTGTGEIFLEPSFGHYIIAPLDGQEMIVDKGMFYASEGTVDVGVAVQKNISSALFGGEGLFQTRLTGTGWVVLDSPVPMCEIRRVVLNNEKLSVDGNFALLRKGKIDFKVERSSKSIFGSMHSGEGLLQTFTGTGEVWIAPTQSVYDRIQYERLNSLTNVKGSMGQNTK